MLVAILVIVPVNGNEHVITTAKNDAAENKKDDSNDEERWKDAAWVGPGKNSWERLLGDPRAAFSRR